MFTSVRMRGSRELKKNTPPPVVWSSPFYSSRGTLLQGDLLSEGGRDLLSMVVLLT